MRGLIGFLNKKDVTKHFCLKTQLLFIGIIEIYYIIRSEKTLDCKKYLEK